MGCNELHNIVVIIAVMGCNELHNIVDYWQWCNELHNIVVIIGSDGV